MSETLHRVLVVGPNPAMDIILEMPGFVSGASQRARNSLHLAGGKPVNVARTLRRLGIEVCLVSPLGGHLGPRQLIAEDCKALGIDLKVCEVREETRTCVIIVDSETGESSVVNELGPHLTDDEARAYVRLVAEALCPDDLVLISGSLPPGLPAGFFMEVVKQARATVMQVIVDTSGEPLRQTLELSPWAVKVNGEELLAVTGASSVEAAVRSLAERVEHVVVTLGAKGALYAGPDGLYRVPRVPVTTVNATGAGDAFLAGLAAALIHGDSWLQALRVAASVATLTCNKLEPDIGPDPSMEAMIRTVEIHSYDGFPVVDGAQVGPSINQRI